MSDTARNHVSAASEAIDRVNKAAKEGKRGLTRQQLIEALAESDMNNGVLLDSLREKDTSIGALQRELSNKAARIRVLEGQAEEDRAKIEALKGMLRAAEVRQARTDGYLDRVHEDDAVRDSVEQIATHEEKRPVNLRSGRVGVVDRAQDTYDHGPGRVYSREERAMTARPATWRDKPWAQW